MSDFDDDDGPRRGGGWLPIAILVATFALELADTIRDSVRSEYRPPEITLVDCVEMCDFYMLPVEKFTGNECVCMRPPCDEDEP